MLDLRRDDVQLFVRRVGIFFSCSISVPFVLDQSLDRQVITLSCTAREDNFFPARGTRADEVSYRLPSLFTRIIGVPPVSVGFRVRISEASLQERKHCVQNPRVNWRRCLVIHITRSQQSLCGRRELEVVELRGPMRAVLDLVLCRGTHSGEVSAALLALRDRLGRRRDGPRIEYASSSAEKLHR